MRCKQRTLHTAFVAPFSASKLTQNFDDLPNQITADLGTPFCFFSNPLMLPEGYGQPDFGVGRALAPTLRATNAGFVVVTIEQDCHSRDQFEEIASSTAATGRFRWVDAELRKYKDYCGYSVVFSGRRSIHFHFAFDTRQLIKAPFDANYAERWLMARLKGEWLFRFLNHADDWKPSTIVTGDYCTLHLCGRNPSPGTFKLPGSLTAQELGDHLAYRFGLKSS